MLIERVGELMTYINGNTDDVCDDLIPEDVLYRLFCEAVEIADSADFSIERVRDVTRERVGSLIPDEESKKHIEDAMAVMSYAYIASQYKKEADRLYETMIKENQNG